MLTCNTCELKCLNHWKLNKGSWEYFSKVNTTEYTKNFDEELILNTVKDFSVFSEL